MSFLVIMLGLALPTAPRAQLSLVVLDPGHGGTNQGAPARYHRGRFEKYYTLVIARRVAERLKKEGVRVVLTRESDRDVSIRERISIANRVGADLFVSIHLNSTERPGPSGHETFFLALEATNKAAKRLADLENEEPSTIRRAAEAPPKDDAVKDILLDLTRNRSHGDGQRLAELIQERMTPRSPFKNRGVKQAPFYVLMGAAMPAVVFEGGFLNHPKEGRYVISEAGIENLADGLALGILDFGRLVVGPRKHNGVIP